MIMQKTESKKNAHSPWPKRIVWGVLGLGAAGALAYAWAPKPLAVETALVAKGPLRVTVDEDGRTRVKDRYVVGAPLSGRVARIELRAGDAVAKGTVLARILPAESPLVDPRAHAVADARMATAVAAVAQSKSSIDRAKIALDSAEKELSRTRELVAKKAVPDVELERGELLLRARTEELVSAKFGADIASHELESARAAADHGKGRTAGSGEQFEVTSPVAGVVLRVLQGSEGVVQAGTPLVEVGDPAALEIAVDVLTVDALHVQPGARVTVERWGGDRPLAAHIRRIEPSAFIKVSALGVEESRVNAIVDLDEPRERWKGLGDGFRVEARLLVWEDPNVLTVPDGALFRTGEDHCAYVVADGKVALRHVSLGRRNGLVAQVLAGLDEGDRVVVHPSDRIKEGLRVVY
jgi:HlyD family secretion protein